MTDLMYGRLIVTDLAAHTKRQAREIAVFVQRLVPKAALNQSAKLSNMKFDRFTK